MRNWLVRLLERLHLRAPDRAQEEITITTHGMLADITMMAVTDATVLAALPRISSSLYNSALDTIQSLPEFRTHHWMRSAGYSDLPVVDEQGNRD